MFRPTSTFAALFTIALLAPACADFDADDDFDRDGDLTATTVADVAAGDEAGGQDGGQGDDCEGSAYDPDCIDDFDRAGDDGSGDDDGGGEGGVCEAYETDLIAAQHDDTGSITLANTNDTLTLSVDAAAPYLLAEIHVYVGTDPVPTKAGAAAPGKFPHTQEFVFPRAGYELELDLADLGVACGDTLNVAVHAVVVAFEDGHLVYEETGWGFGPERFIKSWGWSFPYDICCEPERQRDPDGCTLTRGYWQTHNAYAEVEALQQPWPISEDNELCGQTLLEILDTPAHGDAWYILAHQTIAAALNVFAGASGPDELQNVITYSVGMLAACEISDEDRDLAIQLGEYLDAYNNGEIGPGHCG